jgi:hypothetical protein
VAIEHSALTGSQLHEPKGAATAAAGTVYVANGNGSGTWLDPLDEVYNLNTFTQDSILTDISAASSVYFNVPIKATLTRMSVILYGVVDANTVLTVFINGVLFAQSLTVVAAGSSEGQKQSLTINTSNTIPAGGIVKITSNGAATASVRADVQLELSAVA